MKGYMNITDSELEVMEMLWKQESAIKQSQLLILFEESGKTWKRQTLNTFLSRLEAKGLVTREKGLVETVYSRREYGYIQMKAAIDYLFNGNLCDLVLAYTEKKALGKDEAKEMIRILKNY